MFNAWIVWMVHKYWLCLVFKWGYRCIFWVYPVCKWWKSQSLWYWMNFPVQKSCPMLVVLNNFFTLMLHAFFWIVLQMERWIDDIAGFINNIIGSVLELSNNNSIFLGLLVRQEESLYVINATKEDHKQDIMIFCFNHLKLWIEN